MTTGQAGSVVVRRQLGIQLRKLRLAAGKSVMDVTEAGLGSKAKISRIETGKGPVKVADVRTLCWLYGVDAATTDALAALTPGTQQEGWWEEYGDVVVPDWFGLYAGLEAAASRIRCFEPELVHGLLQTPEYATAVFGSDPRLTSDVIAQRVRFRMERQQQMQRDDPPAVTVIMGESALARLVGSADIMREQIDRLRTETRADVRVLPFSAGAYPLRRSFVLLDFADEEDPSVAYVDVPMGARYFDHDPERAEYEYVFDVIHSKSIPITEWKT